MLPTVTEIAKKLHLEVFLFRAYSNPYGPFVSGRGHYAANLDELMAIVRNEARNYLEEKMAELGKQGVDELCYLLQEGVAPDEIVSVGSHTPESLIVMCSHRRSGVKRWVLGSVTETVVRHSESPVLVLRAGHTGRRMMSWSRNFVKNHVWFLASEWGRLKGIRQKGDRNE